MCRNCSSCFWRLRLSSKGANFAVSCGRMAVYSPPCPRSSLMDGISFLQVSISFRASQLCDTTRLRVYPSPEEKDSPSLHKKMKNVEPAQTTLPEAMMATRSPSTSASSMWCVVTRMVRRPRSPCTTSHTHRRDSGSRPLLGSSRITTCPPRLVPDHNARPQSLGLLFEVVACRVVAV
ncbi:hypothetical protein E2C01_003942 [Portunus trituberculatus]|uniref:Uncharacterized protein n=1 Tax=Portunus trituberculatus TaxID=210409 RepID=A0A5B7CP77_PORTR|nr:hypothetical protein [Portunus trituberculatus]